MKQTILRYLPNIITGVRLMLVLPVVLLLWFDYYLQALVLFAIAGVSDGVDGYLARRFHWESHWGAVMDPMADKLLLVTTAAVIALKGMLPLWLLLLMMVRDVLIVSGAGFYRWWFGSIEVQPSMLGKFSTFIQILLILSLILHEGSGFISEQQIQWMIWICACVTAISGVHYLVVWIRKAANE